MENKRSKKRPATLTSRLNNKNHTHTAPFHRFNQADCEEDFRNAMRQTGIAHPPSQFIADGKFHSFTSTYKKRPNKDCRYVFHGSHGYFCDWSKGIEGRWSILDNLKVKLTRAQRETIQKEIEERERYIREEKTRIHNEVAQKAQDQWLKLSGIGNSKYLERKRIESFGVRFGKNYIAIPLQDVDGKIWSLQKIFDEALEELDTDRVFMKGGRKEGCFHLIGRIDGKKLVIVVEGYATGASVHMATGETVAVAMDAGNLDSAIHSLKGKYQSLNIVIAGDDDAWKDTNKGREKAEAAANKFGCRVVFPKFTNTDTNPTDFNDLHCLEGLEEVKKQINVVLLEKRSKVYTREEFLQMKIPPREMILSPVIPEKGLAMLYAPRGVGKTYVALSIAVTVGQGGSLFDDRWKTPKPMGVLFVDGEMPAHTLQERLVQIGEHTSQNYLKILSADLQDIPIPDLSTKEGQNFIEEHLEGVKLLILDNLSSLCRSGRENESESWQPMQEWLLSLRRRGISVLLIHHANKNGGQRGNSKKEDILDTVISLKRPPHYTPEGGACFEVHYEKARGFYGAEAKPFEVRLQTTNGQLLWVTTYLEDAQLHQILKLHEEGLTQREIAQELDISLSTVNRRLKVKKVKQPVKQEDK